MDRAWELFIKFFLLLLFGPVIIFYAIHMFAALLGVVAAFIVFVLPVVLLGALGIGIVVGLFWFLSRRVGRPSSQIDKRYSRPQFFGNEAVRRPRGKKRRHNDDE